MKLFTVGHSNHSIEAFLRLLQQHKVSALADVRSHPYSRYLPHFSRDVLKVSLQEAGIAYVFLGRELGARPPDLSCYVNGKALYEKIAATTEFQTGLERLQRGAEQYNISLMCAEQDPITCHRAILICRHLQRKGLEIEHILKDGTLESHDALETRLLKLYKLDEGESKTIVQLSLFCPASRAERLQNAYQQQSSRIAYVDKTQQEDFNE
ncbi:DUF488 family protein [Lusitaniella coriacea]|uniref:DUF488 domain-containing protein n=1 Tax=Lusitaniella coriacea TaxID=1983105 RepID=UPI003CF33E4B